MNNEVRDARGKVIGYRCWRCEAVRQSMWGELCNECRWKDEQQKELRDVIHRITSNQQG